jgi:hypothetical protein
MGGARLSASAVVLLVLGMLSSQNIFFLFSPLRSCSSVSKSVSSDEKFMNFFSVKLL